MKVHLFSEIVKDEILACYDAVSETGVAYDCESLRNKGWNFSGLPGATWEVVVETWDKVSTPSTLGQALGAVVFWALAWPVFIFPPLFIYDRLVGRYPAVLLRLLPGLPSRRSREAQSEESTSSRLEQESR